jgi:outer membrane protein TolC
VSKHFFFIVVVLALTVLMLETAKAQEATPLEPVKAEPSTLVPSKAESVVHIQLQRPSIEGNLFLSLNRAVELAVERNPALVVEKIRLEQAREKIQEEKGFYDPLLNLQTSIGRRDNVVASRFFPAGFYVDDEQGYGVNLEAKTYTGGRFSLGLDYKKLASSSNTQTLSPQYSANFAFTFTHALLRDFGWGVNMTRIRVAEKGEAIAASNLSQRVAQLIRQVEEVYWSLVFLLDDLELKKKSLEIAKELLRRNQDLLRAGRVAPVSVTEALAGVAAREEGVITAESEVKKFEDRLKLLLHLDMDKVRPALSDRPEREALLFDMEKSFERALKERPEIGALETELEQRELEQKFAANQTLPRLDLTAQYGMSGISGKPNPTCVDPTSIICVPVGNNVNDSIFAGQTRAKDAFDRFFTRSPFDNWSVQVKLQIPLWNRTAKAQLSEANLRLAETKTRLRVVRDQIAVEVRDAIRDTLTAWKRMEASRQTVRFLEEQLDGIRRRFEAGLTTSYDVLQVLDDLDKARSSENRAVMDYNVGQSKIRLAEGSLLEKYNVEVKKPPRYVFEVNKIIR